MKHENNFKVVAGTDPQSPNKPDIPLVMDSLVVPEGKVISFVGARKSGGTLFHCSDLDILSSLSPNHLTSKYEALKGVYALRSDTYCNFRRNEDGMARIRFGFFKQWQGNDFDCFAHNRR